jgi:hypothetical protein
MEIPQGKTMENSGKQNTKSGFKSPRAEMPTFKWFFLRYLCSKKHGQIQILDPHRLISALKSKTTPGDTLPARPYSYRRLNPKDGSRWVMADDANLDFAANDTEQEVIRNRRKFALRISRSRIQKDSGLSAALVMK